MYEKRRISTLLVLLCLLLTACRYRPGIPRLDIPINEREPEEYTMLSDGTVTCPGAIQGIDVASHQGEIDWKAVRAAGIDFAILQIGYRGYTLGGLNQDARFEENYKGAKEAGIRIGIYFYAQAVSEKEAAEEAEFVLGILSGREIDLPVFYDWEQVSNGRTNGHETTEVGDYSRVFCEAITAGGYPAGVYFNQSYGYNIMQLETLTDYSFWLAEYRGWQSFGYDVAFWQYTGQGRVDGIETTVDRNLMYPTGDQENETAVP